MKKILIFLLVSITIVFFFLLSREELLLGKTQLSKVTEIAKKEEVNEDHPSIRYSNSLWNYLGNNIEEFEIEFGKAVRTDPTIYGYEWKIYHNQNYYVQVGVMDKKIVTLYTNTQEMDLRPFAIGQTYEELKGNHDLNNTIEFDHLRFKLTEEDIKERPVVKLDENKFAQIYIDIYTEQIAGIRFMNKDVFEMQKPYEVYYYGNIKESTNPVGDKWKKIEAGMDQQIFDLTNEVRKSYGFGLLKWDDKASTAAKAHSKDMEQQNYFSHYRLNGDGLQERLMEAGAYYLSAGENIAANYVDVPAVMHGWLNSEGHREALLKKEYTHLGTGTFKLYYTQNFLEK
ncbi:CAP domain-containing protein [Gracilibacillus oryzae]|nr:CAP domain-containing protein [Gracilibacillus oryzae]